MNSVRCLPFACAALLCAACLPPRLTASDGAPADAGRAETGGDALADAGRAETGGDAIADAARAETGGRLTLLIAADENDAVWIDDTDERLHYADDNLTIEVGTDAENGRAGLRFELAVPVGARIVSASLRLRQKESALMDPVTIAIQVYDSVAVAPFDGAHAHAPQDHDPRHLWGNTVTGFMVFDDGQSVTSPDISKLVQRVVDRSEWTGTGFIGFVLSPDQDNFPSPSWVSFDDSSSNGDAASLVVTYASP